MDFAALTKILDKTFIGNRKMRKYRNYIELAMKYAYFPGFINNSENYEKIFNQIKKEAEKLSTKVDSSTWLEGMRKMWEYESRFFWEKNIFFVRVMRQDKNHPDYLVYSTFYKSSDDKSCKEASTIVQKHFNKESGVDDDAYTRDYKDSCEIIYPSNYYLISQTDKDIEICFNGEQIKLYYQEPRKLSGKE